jgi:DNA-directed RNA polymerase subunit alpha
MRVGDRTDYNRLRIFIETDGTLTAHEALEKSIEIMIHQLKAIIGFKEEEPEAEEQAESIEDATTDMNDKKDKSTVVDTAEIFKTRIEELKLSQRVESAMTEAGIRTIGGLVRKREEDLLSIQGLGQKGLQEIKRALSNYGVTLRA